MDHNDRLVGQVYARIHLGDLRIVPRGNLPQKNARQSFWCEFQLCTDTRNVISRNIRSQHRGNVQDLVFACANCSSVMGPSLAPKSTVPASTWRMPPPLPID